MKLLWCIGRGGERVDFSSRITTVVMLAAIWGEGKVLLRDFAQCFLFSPTLSTLDGMRFFGWSGRGKPRDWIGLDWIGLLERLLKPGGGGV